ncbi:MAG TPA: AMP-binding protein [Pseudonocardiaceae bacterium]|nr:AMP-binding protein [Pseudonocardiaceae bacterium]
MMRTENLLAEIIDGHTEPWLWHEDRALSGRQLVSRLTPRTDDRGGMRLVRATSAVAAVIGVLRALSAGATPILWPYRLAVPDWLAAALRPETPAATRLAELLRGDVGRVIGVCSSGTSSGTAKVVFLDVRRMWSNAQAIAARLSASGPVDVVASLRSPAYAAGLVGDVLASLASGSTVWCPSVSVPEIAIGQMTAVPVRAVHCTAAVARRVVTALPAALDRIVLSGDMVTPGVVRPLAAAVPRAALWTGYGLAEAGPRVAMGQLESGSSAGHAGRLLDGVAGHLVDGELVVSTPFGATAALGPAGPYQIHGDAIRTGDLAILAPDGTIRIRGRRAGALPSPAGVVAAEEVEACIEATGVEAQVYAGPGGWQIDLAQGTGADVETTILRLVLANFPHLPVPTIREVPTLPVTDAGKRSSSLTQRPGP